jgi:putative ABC transport system permease protein
MKKPPHWADRFLEWYCSPKLREDLQGDLHERFYERVRHRGLFVARLLFVVAFGLFTMVAIFIACLGLYGLSSYLILLRWKEIAIRKVLGASLNQIVAMISRILCSSCRLLL